jgi:Mrp family chromosome partitioning ATPase
MGMDQGSNGTSRPPPGDPGRRGDAAVHPVAPRAIEREAGGAMIRSGLSGSSPPSSTIGDYATSVWRRKRLVALTVVAGFVFGLLVLPRVGPGAQHQATVRVEAKPLVSSILALTSPGGNGNQAGASSAGRASSTAGQSQVVTANPWQDLRVAEAVLQQLGPQAADLTAVAGEPQAHWAGALAGAMRANPVPGSSTQFDLSYVDKDPARAAAVVERYATVMVDRRNAADAEITTSGLRTLQRDADRLKAEIDELASQADREANAATKTQASTRTLTRLELLSDLWRSKAETIEALQNRKLFLGLPTSVEGSAVVVPASQPFGRAVYVTLGLLLGLLGGVGIALVMEAAKPHVATADDVERATGLDVIGTVPRGGFLHRHPLVVAERPFAPAAEGYRKIATALVRRGLGSDMRVLAIISADRGEGKSTLAANLAEALSRQHQGVVLVSSDLRRPSLERLFSVSPTAGLAEVLEEELEEESDRLLPPLVSVAPNLYLVPAGHAKRNPAELLSSAKFARVIADVQALDAIVLLDSPPSHAAADVLSVAGVADAVLLVTRSGVSRWRSIAELASGARREGLRVAGAVLVGAGTRLGYRYRYRPSASARRMVPSGRWVAPGRRNGGKFKQHEGEVLHVSDSTDRPR